MVPPHEIVIRLFLGAVIGGIIGFEREMHGRAAGFRTQLIVCLAAVLIMVVSENYYFYIRNFDASLRIDPARIAAGALIGIGFLGSGVIIKSGYAVRGLTTAASIWIVSAIGLAIGGGLYFEGLVTAAMTIIALMVLRVVERKIKTTRFKNIVISVPDSENSDDVIQSVFDKLKIHVHSTNYEFDRANSEITYTFSISSRDKHTVKLLFSELKSLGMIHRLKIS